MWTETTASTTNASRSHARPPRGGGGMTLPSSCNAKIPPPLPEFPPPAYILRESRTHEGRPTRNMHTQRTRWQRTPPASATTPGPSPFRKGRRVESHRSAPPPPICPLLLPASAQATGAPDAPPQRGRQDHGQKLGQHGRGERDAGHPCRRLSAASIARPMSAMESASTCPLPPNSQTTTGFQA